MIDALESTMLLTLVDEGQDAGVEVTSVVERLTREGASARDAANVISDALDRGKVRLGEHLRLFRKPDRATS